jgi:tRNA threonylcarbamoyladenosine biosynthesis protein TsaE
MRWHARTAEATEAVGARLAQSRPPGNALAVIYLDGDLGAGKTTLARGFLHASGVAGAVRSPTYTLVETYEMPELFVLHIDLYRLRELSELEPLGLRECARDGYVWLVEWPQRAQERLPVADLIVTLTAGPQGHDIAAISRSQLGDSWLAALATVEMQDLHT